MAIDTVCSYAECHYAVAYKPFRLIVVTLNVIVLSVIMVNVMAPNERFIFVTDKRSSLEGKSESYARRSSIR